MAVLAAAAPCSPPLDAALAQQPSPQPAAQSIAMPSLPLPSMYLCVDGGGTSVRVSVATVEAGVIAKGVDGPCNVKTVGVQSAVRAILTAVERALAKLPYSDAVDWTCEPPKLRRRVFKTVWLGLAGIQHQDDIDQVSSVAHAVFHIPKDENESLRITNDGHLLASPCAFLSNVDSAVVLVAGTGTVGFRFTKQGNHFQCAGITRGWGYLLGDDGSAYNLGRLAIRSLLQDNDSRQSACLVDPTHVPSKLLPLYASLLKYFGVSSCTALIDKTYSDHSSPLAPSFQAAEAARKVWIAEAARIVFSYAFGDKDAASKEVAVAIAKEAVQELVDMAARLVAGQSQFELSRSALSLGGGLWKVQGYRDLLVEALSVQKGIEFAEVVVVGDPAEEGVRALIGHK